MLYAWIEPTPSNELGKSINRTDRESAPSSALAEQAVCKSASHRARWWEGGSDAYQHQDRHHHQTAMTLGAHSGPHLGNWFRLLFLEKAASVGGLFHFSVRRRRHYSQQLMGFFRRHMGDLTVLKTFGSQRFLLSLRNHEGNLR
ncbi:hypothetical protein [Bradyrhizobium genosp. P]|uniref:hypothetical protein n=1 Tax=Bradyrhizobium genosp. P TaxID=83641 RepID=UPI003CEA306A